MHQSHELPRDVESFNYDSEKIDTAELARELSTELKFHADQVLQQLLVADKSLTPAIREHIQRRDLTVPSIETYTTVPDIRQTLERVGYADNAFTIHPNEALLLIRLPPHLNHFYNRPRQSDIPSWSKHYSALVDELWDTARSFAVSNDLKLERINPPGIHEKEYYYLWTIHPSSHQPRVRGNK